MNAKNDAEFVCDISAIPADERAQHEANGAALFGAVEEVRELANGYAMRLPNDTAILFRVAEFISRERLCCPFFNFALEVEAHHGPFWLRLTGAEGIKSFVGVELGSYLEPSAAQRVGSGRPTE